MSIKLDQKLFDSLMTQAAESPRLRSHFNLHTDLEAPVQRLCIGLQKGTYVRPHHHPAANKWEIIMVLRGEVALLTFDDQGVVQERMTLTPGQGDFGIELAPGTWHTVLPLSEQAVIMEVKEGPYTPAQPSDFAQWAPAEGEPEVSAVLQWLENAASGEQFQG